MRNRRSLRAERATTKQRALLIALSVGALAACGAADQPQDPGNSQPSVGDRGQDGAGAAAASAGSAPVVASRDSDGTPKFIWSSAPGKTSASVPIGGQPSVAARAHLMRNASLLGVSEKLVRSAVLSNEHVMPGGGSVHSFTQKVGGIEVFRTRASVVLDSNNNLVAISGNLRAAAASPSKVGRFLMTPEQALARAYADRFGITLPSSAITDVGPEANGEYREYRVTTPAGAPRLMETARVRKVYMPEKGRLVAAYHAEFVARAKGSRDNDGWLYAIAADNGRTLVRSSITAHDKFTYRVWAEAGQNNIPTDGPLVDSTPLAASATPAAAEKAGAAPILVTVDGFNKNPAGAADPWLPAAATVLTGNNVDAYSDRNSKSDGTGDGFDVGIDIRPDVTAPKTFDRTYNLAQQPEVTPNQIKASVTQLFYVNNWMHDYWYDSGFDEKAGNAQASNFGRGGKQGDPLLAQGQDGADVGESNNANMSTYSDGRSPRMQMYVWSGPPNSKITTVPAIVFDDPPGSAVFGPQTFNLTGPAVLADVADACTAPTNVAGKIAVIDRGNCNFDVKALNVQGAGATGIVLVNKDPGHVAPSPGAPAPGVTIPLIGISLEDGVKLKAKLAAGVTATLFRGAEILRDGTIDNGVVAHEWGHYLHHRLVECGNQSCGGMSEGWADFNALMMVIKGTDDLEGTTYPLTQYAAVSPYFGIRRAPYSSDFKKNPFTFKHISKKSTLPTGVPLFPVTPDMSEVHNVGEVWAQTLFEAYTNLLRDTKGATPRLTFDQAKRRMADYVVAGMKATPPEPTFVEQRDAVLAVAYARDAKDFDALAKGFAKRGMGVGAVAPPGTSEDLSEALEDSSFKGNLAYVDSKIDDAVRSCDRDGFLDADEKGDVTIRVRNAGWVTLKGSTATVATTTAGVTLGNGGKGTILSIDPFGVVKVRIGIAFDAAATKQAFVPITVTLTNPDSFSATVTGNIEPLANFDIADASTATDTVESPKSAWTLGHGGSEPADAWTRKLLTVEATGKPVSPPNFHWHGADLSSRSDESLVSPALTVSPTVPFKITFKHKYKFEVGPDAPGNPDVYFDGGVIEYSQDNGATWIDVATIVDPGYTQTFYVPVPASPNPAEDDNPLAGRRGFAGELPVWTPTTIDLGAALAGKTVKVRFRLGSDGGTSAPGWDIDDLAFTGITNKPFPSLVDDVAICKGVPIAKAGDPQTVLPEAVVKLDGSGSSDPDKDPITFVWEQLDGAGVKLSTPETVSSTFTAPKVTEETKLVFRVTVADAKQAASDTVEITVKPATAIADAGPDGNVDLGNAGTPGTPPDDSCACTQVGASKNAGFGALGAMLAGLLALVFRSRRSRNSG